MRMFLSAWENSTSTPSVDSGNTFANVISPQTMSALGIETSQLEPVPQLSVVAPGKKMRVLGQAPRLELQFGQHPAKFRIRPLVLQGLVNPLNLCGPFLRRVGIDQLHSRGTLSHTWKGSPDVRSPGSQVAAALARGLHSPGNYTCCEDSTVSAARTFSGSSVRTHDPEGGRQNPLRPPRTVEALSSGGRPSAHLAHRAVPPG